MEGSYVGHLANRYADTLIARNTDIVHHSRWQVWGTGDQAAYSFNG